jgi:hypothetical protein
MRFYLNLMLRTFKRCANNDRKERGHLVTSISLQQITIMGCAFEANLNDLNICYYEKHC